MADNPYTSAIVNPAIRQPGLYDMRLLSTANRSESPFERGARGPSRQGVSGNPMLAQLAGMANNPDYSQFTYNPAMHDAALAAGVQPLEANQVRQNQILPNTGFFGRHPRLSGALEGGIFGALAAHGGETVGDSIQGALEGVVGGRRIRQGMYNQQFARPFEAAGMLAGLQDQQQRRDLQAADIERMRAENQKIGRPDHDMHAIGVNKSDQSIYTYDNTTGSGSFTPNPDFDPALVRSQRVSSDLDIGTREQLRIMGVTEPGSASPAQIKEANRLSQAQAVERSGAFAAAGANAKIPTQNYQDARREHDKRVDSLNNQMLKNNDPSHQKWAEDQILDQRLAESLKPGFHSPSPDYLINVTPQDRDGYIAQYNQRIQSQIDTENSGFNQQWPQTIEAPPTPKGSKKSGPPKVRDYTQVQPH